jgi:hypothetical protein
MAYGNQLLWSNGNTEFFNQTYQGLLEEDSLLLEASRQKSTALRQEVEELLQHEQAQLTRLRDLSHFFANRPAHDLSGDFRKLGKQIKTILAFSKRPGTSCQALRICLLLYEGHAEAIERLPEEKTFNTI